MKILLPVDGSELSLEAVHFALRLMRNGLKTRIVLANVQEAATFYELMTASDPEIIERAAAEAGLHSLQPALKLLEAAGADYECEVAKGDPAHTIVEIAERFDCHMIIMGARGASALRSAMMGSVANEVLHASSIPVVIVKPPESDEA